RWRQWLERRIHLQPGHQRAGDRYLRVAVHGSGRPDPAHRDVRGELSTASLTPKCTAAGGCRAPAGRTYASAERKSKNRKCGFGRAPSPPPFFVTAHSKGLTETRFRNCAF